MTESTFLRRTALQIFKSLKILTIYTPICFHINSWQTFLLRINQTCLYASQNRAEHFILGLFLKLKHCSYKWLKKWRKLVFYTLYIVEYLCFPTRYFRWLAVLPVNSVVGTFICKHPFGILISACTIMQTLRLEGFCHQQVVQFLTCWSDAVPSFGWRWRHFIS